MQYRILISIVCFLFLNIASGQNQPSCAAILDKELAAVLDTIFQDDQQFREKSLELEKQFGWKSVEVQRIWDTIHTKDSLNLIKVEKILDEKGWLGPDQVGEEGNTTLFLVIQHSTTQTQVKYLPMLREAVKNGKAKARHLALMEDRVLLAQGEKQIYGSQLEMDNVTSKWVLSPMIDPDNVDKRRKDVGLNPLAEYLSNWELTWDVEVFKQKMAELDAARQKK